MMNGNSTRRAIVVGASSGIGQEVAKLLMADNYELPVLNGDSAHDEALKKKYEGRA